LPPDPAIEDAGLHANDDTDRKDGKNRSRAMV
jgi:hypothetical protein